MRKIILAVCASVLVLSACSRRDVKESPETQIGMAIIAHNSALVYKVSKTAIQIEKAILAGCSHRGWVCSKISEGLIEGSIHRSRYYVAVTIPYEKGSYKIIYEDHQNLNYKGKKRSIHKAYVRWINNLNRSIHAALANPVKYAKYTISEP
ncbi:MAG: hypothetical protein LBG46_06145 [Elusimicrobiota bacterium]|jgi:hypothetical protein|nr:hypothetical protein [Elusimicrobiota bacterium]